MNKATWFKPAEYLDLRKRRISQINGDPYYRYVARFGLEYIIPITHPMTDEAASNQFQLEVKRALYEMEHKMMKWIIQQWYAVPTEQLERFILVETPHIPKGKPVILLHPEDRTKLLDSIDGFVGRYSLFAVKPLKEALKDG